MKTIKYLITLLLILLAASVFTVFLHNLQKAREKEIMLKSYPYNHSKIPNK